MEEELRQCPYDPNHKVRSSRFEIHILKCKKNNDKKDNSKKVVVEVCPFNAKHQVLRTDYRHHLCICPDRNRINEEKLFLCSEANVNRYEICARDEVVSNFNDDEDWEKEAKIAPQQVQVGERINPAYSYCNLSKKERKEFNNQLIDNFKKNQSGEGKSKGFW